ncbi:MAG: General secretion pathway protein D [candidate division TM6 bacterium GW2011_GWE2_41_16]|nr:MAG: General secretion pathway protein D [candidate division TM6 bacterium GW2011_GWE2_41_16]
MIVTRKYIFIVLGFVLATMSFVHANDKTMAFRFDNTDLSTIVSKYAKKLKKNLLLPQGVVAINQKVTFKQIDRLSLDKAESYIRIFLELAGYTMYPKGDMLVVSKLDQNNARNLYPIYINASPFDLPRSPEHIHAIYYLENMKVPGDGSGNDAINTILQTMLSPVVQGQVPWFFDSKLNAIIVTDRADNIAAAMNIILTLDKSGNKEVLATMPLYHISAGVVATWLKEKIAKDQQAVQFKATPQTESNVYFESNMKIKADPRTNTLILIGRENAIERVKNFINEYIDVPLEMGKSVVHVYNLQYLNSEEIAGILQNIVKGDTSSSGQSNVERTDAQRFFDSPLIAADTMKPSQTKEGESAQTSSGLKSSIETGPITIGGNRLVIAAKDEDWVRIKKLLQELDQPQMQVIFEVLVVDLTARDSKNLSAQMRTPEGLDLPQGMAFQSAQITAPILNNLQTTGSSPTVSQPTTTLNADLLRLLLGAKYSMAQQQTSTTLGGENGSMIVSFKDVCTNSIWMVLKMLQKYAHTKILSHPYIVTLNNKVGSEISTEIRQASGNAEQTSTGFNIKQKEYPAKFSISFTPRISSFNRLGFKLAIEVTEFTTNNASSTDYYNRINRTISSYINMKSGDLLAIGGLTTTSSSESRYEVPFFSKLPIIGNLFRGRDKGTLGANLAVFIVPTIVQPKRQDGLHHFTTNKAQSAMYLMHESEVVEERDPVQRWFFGGGSIDENADLRKLESFLQDSNEYKGKKLSEISAAADDPLVNAVKKTPLKMRESSVAEKAQKAATQKSKSKKQKDAAVQTAVEAV